MTGQDRSLRIDGAVVSPWSRTQKLIATSSAEAELYAVGAGGGEAVALRELFLDASSCLAQ